MQRKLQELLLIRPLDLAFRKLLAVRGRWWRICDLGDQIRCRCFRNAVDQDTQKRDLEEDVEADTESEQYTLAVMKPVLFLLFRKTDSREVGFEL